MSGEADGDSWVLLDRDGVINEDSDAYIKSPDEWVPIPGSLQAIALLNQHGFRVAVLTNQSGLARGLFDAETLRQIHAKMFAQLAAAGGRIDNVFVCPHAPEDGCDCRKPRTGLFQQFALKYGVALAGVPAVGDALRDLQAAQAVGCAPILVETGKGEMTLQRYPNLEFPCFYNLYEVAQHLIQSHS